MLCGVENRCQTGKFTNVCYLQHAVVLLIMCYKCLEEIFLNVCNKYLEMFGIQTLTYKMQWIPSYSNCYVPAYFTNNVCLPNVPTECAYRMNDEITLYY